MSDVRNVFLHLAQTSDFFKASWYYQVVGISTGVLFLMLVT